MGGIQRGDSCAINKIMVLSSAITWVQFRNIHSVIDDKFKSSSAHHDRVGIVAQI